MVRTGQRRHRTRKTRPDRNAGRMREPQRGRPPSAPGVRPGKKAGPDGGRPGQPAGAWDRGSVSAKRAADLGPEPKSGAVRSFESFFSAVHGEVWNTDRAFGNV